MQRLVGGSETVALLVARRTNDRKVADSSPTKVVCWQVTAWGKLSAVAGRDFFRAVRS